MTTQLSYNQKTLLNEAYRILIESITGQNYFRNNYLTEVENECIGNVPYTITELNVVFHFKRLTVNITAMGNVYQYLAINDEGNMVTSGMGSL